MNNFDKAIIKILKNEDASGKGKVTVDSGGVTRWGISQNAYPHENIRQLSKARAIELYKRDYWDKLNLDQVHDFKIAQKLFDSAVNMGVNRTAKYIQEIVHVKPDGVIGPVTINAINARNGDELVELYRDRQEAYYRYLATSNPQKYARYLNGWLTRVTSC